MMRRIHACFFLPLLLINIATSLQAQNKAAKTLSQEEFISIVRSFHPVAKQAGLVVKMAEAGVQASRGSFDPFVATQKTEKTFDGTRYYDYLNPEMKIPLWYGMDIVTGMENNAGLRIDESVTAGKSSYLGVNIPIAKNLFFDRRRADVLQAKVFRQQSQQEQLLIINNLLYDAYAAYWNWVKEYQVYRIVSGAVAINRDRFDFVKNTALLGDRPFIDTTEVLAQLQNFLYLQSDARMNYLNAGLQLSNFMWLANDSAFVLDESVIPDTLQDANNIATLPIPSVDDFRELALTRHPKLRSIGFKLDILQIEKRYKFQNLLPKVDLKYNVLSKGYYQFKSTGTYLLENNYRFGFNIAMPLFLREARGQYKMAKIKIADTRLEQQQTALEIINKVRSYYNELMGYREQVLLKEAALLNYRSLLSAEWERFREGESSVFLINTRENKVIEESGKLAELKAKFYKSLQALPWAAGQLR